MRAESFFQIEAALGTAIGQDLSDGTWYQLGVPHHERLNVPAVTAGLVFHLSRHLDAHLDYTYMGQFSASCLCVSDAEYNPRTHVASRPGYIPFNGFGHTNLLSLTLEPYWVTHGIHIGLDLGPVVYWNTWHDSAIPPSGPLNLSHHTTAQFGATVGVRLEWKNTFLTYHYYLMKQQWNPTPSLIRGVHLVELGVVF